MKGIGSGVKRSQLNIIMTAMVISSQYGEFYILYINRMFETKMNQQRILIIAWNQ